MKLQGTRGQFSRDFGFYLEGALASTSAPQLILPENKARSSFFFQNTGSSNMRYGFGSARASATISGGAVTSVSISNAGFNFTRAPHVRFLGGGQYAAEFNTGFNSSYVGAGGPDFPAPQRPAKATATIAGGVVTAITINDGGAGYVVAPYVQIFDDVLDPNGAFDPSSGGGAGFILFPGQSLYEADNVVVTDPFAVFCNATASFALRWTP